MSILPLTIQAIQEGESSQAMSALQDFLENLSKPYIIAVDFDGTLCENCWPEIGSANAPILQAIILLRRLGVKIILWTCREAEDLENALAWCNEHHLTFDAINENCDYIIDLFQWNTRKIHADEYWDDRAVSISYPFRP